MRRHLTALIIAGTLIVAASVTSLVIWLNEPSYDDVVKDCQKALVSQSKAGEKGKPGACKDVKDDDYTALVMNNAIKRS
ncbi:hypothetical protein OG416_36775 (plasmid) [Streptomyces longwoodensis]|uniref:hypothetical protein n=1 Tax=Streptomyces longwoodensis TaxID=68231 RepID=UPI002F9160A1|nr:hypothetical protein OG416_36775 [Streptomyces longwoodensis]